MSRSADPKSKGMGPDDWRDAQPNTPLGDVGPTADRSDASAPGRGSFSRRQMLAGLGGAAAAGAGVGSLPVAEATQSARASGGIGVASVGGTASRLVGRIDQNGGNFLAYGFFTLIAGLSQRELFSNPGNPVSESTAHFTFHGTASLVQRTVIDSRVFVIDVVGSLGHYYQSSPSARFSDPASFTHGIRVATSEFSLQDVLSTIAPNEGIPTIEGPMRQLSSLPFHHRGRRLHVGHTKLRSHLMATGRGTRTEPTTPVVHLSIAGDQVVTG
jgi:hypothetical protein